MNQSLAVCIALTMSAGSACASVLCEEMRALKADASDLQMTLPGSDATANCTRSLVLAGGTQVHCGWAFSYRAPEATRAFERLVASVGDCLGDSAAVTADLDVNHPDFYDLQTFQLGGQEIGVSLKDKAALSETYVFLRITLPK